MVLGLVRKMSLLFREPQFLFTGKKWLDTIKILKYLSKGNRRNKSAKRP